jgi:transcriptional regulator with XRE-family HTH domain
MKLADYLSQNNLSPADFAEAIGVNRSNVHRFCTGERRPDLATLERIHNATGGQVTAVDFFENPPVAEEPQKKGEIPTQPTNDSPASNVSQNELKPPSKGSKTLSAKKAETAEEGESPAAAA